MADRPTADEAVTLARAYLDLHAEVERLSRVLRVEQGDADAAPEGWGRRRGWLWKRGPWQVYRRAGRRVRSPLWPPHTKVYATALEAMEAADRAAGGAA